MKCFQVRLEAAIMIHDDDDDDDDEDEDEDEDDDGDGDDATYHSLSRLLFEGGTPNSPKMGSTHTVSTKVARGQECRKMMIGGGELVSIRRHMSCHFMSLLCALPTSGVDTESF